MSLVNFEIMARGLFGTAEEWKDNPQGRIANLGEMLRCCLKCCEQAHEDFKNLLDASVEQNPEYGVAVVHYADLVDLVVSASENLFEVATLDKDAFAYGPQCDLAQVRICIEGLRNLLKSDAVMKYLELRRRRPFALRPGSLDPAMRDHIQEMLNRPKRDFIIGAREIPEGDIEALLEKHRAKP